jgi:hypothetical protein
MEIADFYRKGEPKGYSHKRVVGGPFHMSSYKAHDHLGRGGSRE